MFLSVMKQKSLSPWECSLACCALVLDTTSFRTHDTDRSSLTVDGLVVTKVVVLWIFSTGIGIFHILRLVGCSVATVISTTYLQHQKMLRNLLIIMHACIGHDANK